MNAHRKVQNIARQIVEAFREDPSKGPLAEQEDDGKCGFCGYIFTDADCQHEVLNRVACDSCYLARGGR